MPVAPVLRQFTSQFGTKVTFTFI